MGFYRNYIVPPLIHLAMKNREAARLRATVIPSARGRVLEIGIGSGLNLPYYTDAVDALCGIDPSGWLLHRAQATAAAAPFPVAIIQGSAEALPLEDRGFDRVVTTWTLCSIPDPLAALAEMRRVLKPSGELIFVEHGHAADAGVRAWQDRLNPLWRRLAGGCNMNRDIDRLIREAGFAIARAETGYLVGGPRILSYLYEGVARVA
jgi:ubiquinone/menaquinone biosynthesis C-methylase UbiE